MCRVALLRFRPEVDVSERRGVDTHRAVPPGPDDHPGRCFVASNHRLEVFGCSVDERVEPAAGDEAGDVGVVVPVGRLVVAVL